MLTKTAVIHPLLFEINTRCWLNELSATQGCSVHLGNIPTSEFQKWQQLGFTHIWLMGVWTIGERGRKHSLTDPGLLKLYDDMLPSWQSKDIAGSPYAIVDYQVRKHFGGEDGLRRFRQQLHQHGIRLILDFVPNHFGTDHLWLKVHPDFLINSSAEKPETFSQETSHGSRWFAHGKDAYFPAWKDTVQVNYRNPQARAAMVQILNGIAKRCDGVRCDMAMLVLNDIFEKTWSDYPNIHGKPATEFWTEAIKSVRSSYPEFLFLAESYWGLERRLQGLGFNYTYDKHLYDLLLKRDARQVSVYLYNAPLESLCKSAHFLENHDEPRISKLLPLEVHRALALLILSLPGMRFLHEGQLTGKTTFSSVHLSRRLYEPEHPEISSFYKGLLESLKTTSIGRGQPILLQPHRAWEDKPTASNFIVTQWHESEYDFDLAVINLAPHRSQCYVLPRIKNLSMANWNMTDLLGTERYERSGKEMALRGLYLDLPPFGAQLFHFSPTRTGSE